MKHRSFKYFLSVTLSILSLLCLAVGFVACAGNKETKKAIVAWATKTTETVEYFDYYFAPMDVVVANGEEFLPAVKVEDSKGEAIALVSDKFLIEDMDGYVVKYIIGYNGASFEKKITLNVVLANPNVFVGDMGDCYAGIDCLVPTIAVMENDGEKIDYTTKVVDAQNQEVTITEGRFNAPTPGEHFLMVTAQGKNGQTVVHKETFTVEEIPVGKDVLLKNTEINADWYTTPDGLMPNGLTVYGYKGVKSSGKNMKVALDLGISLELLRAKFVSVQFYVVYMGDGVNAVDVKSSQNGTPIPVHFEQFDQFLPNLVHWQYYTITVPTAEFDGNLYFSSTGGAAAVYQLGFVTATAVCEGLTIEAYEKEQMVNTQFSLPAVSYVLNNVEIPDANIAISATFNGEEVDVQESYVFPEVGEFVVTYTCNGFSKTVTFNINLGKMLVTMSNLISKTTVAAGKATLGNVSGAQITAGAAYCIKLPAEPDWSTNTVTLSIDVGDVSGYSKLQMTFWGLGLQGDTWFLYVNGVEVFTHQGWRGWDNPVTIDIPVSEVINGQLLLTFTQTWQVGDELYIQSIEAFE